MERENNTTTFMLGTKTVKGEIVKENAKTVWVRVKDRIIKRHKEKHKVAA